MKVVIYTRASTTEQGITLDAQRAKLTAYAAALDLEVMEVVEDAGESAKSLQRPGLQRALQLLKNGQADGMLVTKLDRLSRSVADWQTLVSGYFSERAGNQLLSLGDSIDTRSAAGRLVLNVLMSVAAWRREAIGERTKTALQHKISKRERVGAVRFGFDLAEDGCSLLENWYEQEAITLMVQLRDTGHSLRAIAGELNDRAIPTKTGNATWTHTAVAYILRRQPAA